MVRLSVIYIIIIEFKYKCIVANFTIIALTVITVTILIVTIVLYKDLGVESFKVVNKNKHNGQSYYTNNY